MVKATACVLISFVLAATVPAAGRQGAPGPEYQAAVDCDDRPALPDKMHCEQLRLDKAEERLGNVYDRLAELLGAKLRLKLTESQESWIAFREANFDFAASMLSKSGQGGLLKQVKSMRKMTEKRVLELEALLEAATETGIEETVAPSDDRLSRKTRILSDKEAQKLFGAHRLRLQWISEEPAGRAVISDKDGLLVFEGEQRKGDQVLRIHGVITEVREGAFLLEGTVVTEVEHLNDGRPCIRTGEFIFLRRRGRPFWRMQDIDNPCAEAVDYIDMFL